MKRYGLFIFLLFFFWFSSFPELASAIWIGIESINISPEHPTDLDSVTVYINGAISTPCDSIWYDRHQIQGNRIDLHLQFYDYHGVCAQEITPFYLQIPIGRLPAGICTLVVIVDSYPYFWGMVFEVTEHSPTGILDSPQDLVNKFALSYNYPNPFNSTTQIDYVVQEDGFISLFILNLLGQRVKTLENEFRSKGSYIIYWDGRDDSGKEVASGIYFYQLRAGNFIETKKLMLIK